MASLNCGRQGLYRPQMHCRCQLLEQFPLHYIPTLLLHRIMNHKLKTVLASLTM